MLYEIQKTKVAILILLNVSFVQTKADVMEIGLSVIILVILAILLCELVSE